MTTTSGLPASSSSGRMPSRASPARKSGVVDPVRLGVGLGVGDRGGDRLHSPDLAGVGRHREADRADPAEQVEEPLVAAQGRVLAGDPVEQLGGLGVGLQEGVAARPRARARRAARAAAPRRARRSGRWCRRCSPSTIVCRSVGGSGIVAGTGDQPGLDLAGAASLANDQVAQHADAGPAVVGRGSPRAAAQSRTSLRAALLASEASRQSSTSTTRSQRPRAWKPSATPAGGVAVGPERVLELVAVAPLLDRWRRSARPRRPRSRRSAPAPRGPGLALCSSCSS